ncbi:7529_t:CDS:1, partial [Gigaspora rosea]
MTNPLERRNKRRTHWNNTTNIDPPEQHNKLRNHELRKKATTSKTFKKSQHEELL